MVKSMIAEKGVTFKELEKIYKWVCELLVKGITEQSYRACAVQVSEMTG